MIKYKSRGAEFSRTFALLQSTSMMPQPLTDAGLKSPEVLQAMRMVERLSMYVTG